MTTFCIFSVSNFAVIAKCNDPGKPENGTKDGEDYRSGANVTFRCYPPFELLGSPTIHCKNGKWSSSTPICTSEYGNSKKTCNQRFVPLKF